MNRPLRLFFSYSHADDLLQKEMEKHLKPLVHAGIIEIWSCCRIPPGTEWEKEIDRELEDADVILFLVSPDFIASDYCWGREVQRALVRYKRGEVLAIPIILRPVDWKSTPLGKLQALPTTGTPVTDWSNQDNAWLDVAQGIRRIVIKDHQPGINDERARLLDHWAGARPSIRTWELIAGGAFLVLAIALALSWGRLTSASGGSKPVTAADPPASSVPRPSQVTAVQSTGATMPMVTPDRPLEKDLPLSAPVRKPRILQILPPFRSGKFDPAVKTPFSAKTALVRGRTARVRWYS